MNRREFLLKGVAVAGSVCAGSQIDFDVCADVPLPVNASGFEWWGHAVVDIPPLMWENGPGVIVFKDMMTPILEKLRDGVKV